MYLKYRSRKSNWNIIEIESITFANVHIGEITAEFNSVVTKKSDEALRTTDEFVRKCMEKIQNETSCDVVQICDCTTTELLNLNSVSVISYKPTFSEEVTILLNTEAYILNDKGVTIERIAG